jgi:hypothetical protein
MNEKRRKLALEEEEESPRSHLMKKLWQGQKLPVIIYELGLETGLRRKSAVKPV